MHLKNVLHAVKEYATTEWIQPITQWEKNNLHLQIKVYFIVLKCKNAT